MYKTSISALFVCSSLCIQAQTVLAFLEFEASNVTTIEVKGKFCDIDIKPSDRVRFKGLIEGNGESGDYEIVSDLDGSTLTIELKKRIRQSDSHLTKAYFNIDIPDGIRLTINNTSGDIDAQQLSGYENWITTTSGDVTIGEITGKLSVTCTSGDVSVLEGTGELEVISTSGDQHIKSMKGRVKVKSTSGDQEFSEITGDLSAQSTSGDMSIAGLVGGLDLNSTSGDIFGKEILLKSSSVIRTTSGEIQMDLGNEEGDLSFILTASSGDLQVEDQSGEKTLRVGTGHILITGVSTSGDQLYGF